MGAKKLSDADKAQAVSDLLQGRGTMAKICDRYGISPTYLYKLRDRALEALKVVVAGGEKRDISRERQLELELNRAKQLIGDQALVIEILKKAVSAGGSRVNARAGAQLRSLRQSPGAPQIHPGARGRARRTKDGLRRTGTLRTGSCA